MAGIDDNVAIIGDWVPPSPSTRAFFTAMLGSDIGLNSIAQSSDGSRTEGLFLGMGSRGQMVSGNEKDGSRADNSDPQLIKSNSFSEQKANMRGGLVERMAARAGFNAPRLNTESIRSGDLSLSSDVRSPYLTIPPGLSPTSLLESPVFLSNSLAQPSPTTGKFPFHPNGNIRGSSVTEATNKSKDNFFEDMNTSFAFKPIAESGSSFFLGAPNKMPSATVPRQSFHSNEISVHSENSFQSQITEPSKVQLQSSNSFSFQAPLSMSSMEKDNRGQNGNNAATDQTVFGSVGGCAEQSPPLDEQQEEEGDQRGSGESVGAGGGGAPSQDGYNWRKYGQKQVKGSEYPRSYYKCTHPNCQVKKKVERSHEGHITEIIYKGGHSHAKPAPNRRSAMGSSNQLTDMQLDVPEQGGADGDTVWASSQKGTAGTPDWRPDNFEATSTAAVGPEYGNASTTLQGQNGAHHESGEALDVSSTFSNDEEEDDRGTHGSVSLGYDGEGDESESKRRKIEAYATEMSGATRAIREPRVVVQTTSEVDILDDGYRWRKYGQKVVKGNPNPRSYYKCTSAGCTVRKHVERASHDLKSVITTYEGKHNHDVPAARNSSHVNAGASNTGHSQTAGNASALQNHIHRPEPSQVHNSMGRFSIPGRQQLGPPHGFSFGMNQQGLANLAMAGLGPGQGKMPVMHVHPYLAQQQHQINEMGFMLPKGELKMEPISKPGMNLTNGSSVYQLMSQLPLGPHM